MNRPLPIGPIFTTFTIKHTLCNFKPTTHQACRYGKYY